MKRGVGKEGERKKGKKLEKVKKKTPSNIILGKMKWNSIADKNIFWEKKQLFSGITARVLVLRW